MKKNIPLAARAKRPGFTLVEFMVVISIVVVLGAVSSPLLSVMTSEARLETSAARIRGALLRIQQVSAENRSTPNYDDTLPPVAGSAYLGDALVCRWDPSKLDYELFWAHHNQAAKDAAGAYLAKNNQGGYSRILDFEPMFLGEGVRAAGLRRDDSKPDRVALLPDNFAVLIDATGVSSPPLQTVYVNLQTTPSNSASLPDPQPWRQWNTGGMYDGGAVNSLGTGEGFPTSLPMVILYRNDDIPPEGTAPSGADWRNADGSLGSSVLPSDLLQTAKCRIVAFPLQGGSPIDY
jgi:prepilin-type N-terminal cleavage/methylation domain-containing protein